MVAKLHGYSIAKMDKHIKGAEESLKRLKAAHKLNVRHMKTSKKRSASKHREISFDKSRDKRMITDLRKDKIKRARTVIKRTRRKLK